MIALDVGRGLGRVDVLGLAVAEGATAEGDDVPRHVPDREHQPVSESIVVAAAALPRQHQTTVEHLLRAESLGLEVVVHRLPGVGREADADAFSDLVVDAAGCEVVAANASTLVIQQHRPEEVRSDAVHPV